MLDTLNTWGQKVQGATGSIKNVTDFLTGTSKAFELQNASAGFGTINKIIRQNIPYMLELDDDGKISYYIFPRGVEQWKSQYTPRGSVTYTQGGVFQDIVGLAAPKINISGTFGYANTTRTDGLDGATLQHLLHDMMRGFYLAFGEKTDFDMVLESGEWHTQTSGTQGKTFKKAIPKKPPKLNFYDFVTHRHWEVSIDNFEFTRNIQRKFLYMYSINMTGIQRVAATNQKEKAAATKFPPKQKVNDFLQALKDIKAFMRDIKAFLSSIKQLKDAAMGYVNDVLNVVKQATDIINTGAGLITEVSQLPNQIAKELVATTTNLTDSLINLNNTLIATTPQAAAGAIPLEMVTKSRDTQRTAYQMDLATRNNGVTIDNVPKPAPVAATAATYSSNTYGNTPSNTINSVKISKHTRLSGFTEVDGKAEENLLASIPFDPNNYVQRNISESDTIYSIATKNGVDWEQVVALNDLDYPYISHDYSGTKRILKAGDIIKIPAKTDAPPEVPVQFGATYQEMLYGIDEELDENGYHIVKGTDIKTIGGYANLIMQLQHILMTPRGQIAELKHPEYGTILPEFIGRASTEIWQERARLECELVLQQDARVNGVGKGEFNVNGTALFYNSDVYPIGQIEPISVAFPIDKMFA